MAPSLLRTTLIRHFLGAIAASLVFPATAGNEMSLTGTWASKSGAVFTGPDFYDPTKERLYEPRLTGSSFSFTDDGHFEEAIYVTIANPTKPDCPKAIMQFQHGDFILADNGSLVLHPIAVDGRQLLSDPCTYDTSIYSRFNQTEVYQKWDILKDGYRSQVTGTTTYRLNLFKHDGASMNPLYRSSSEPTMHPTTTLTPLPTEPPPEPKKRSKRLLLPGSLCHEGMSGEKLWWIGFGLAILGGIGYFCV